MGPGRNVVSVSWPDHLSFGEGAGRLATPDAVARRMEAWRSELDARALHWRLLRTWIDSEFYGAPGYEHATLKAARELDWNDLETVPRLAADAGLEAWLYVAVFDEGWPLADAHERARSYHNDMHCQHVAWQTAFVRDHPEVLIEDAGGARQYGVPCLVVAEVREHFVERFANLLDRSDFDGLFVCLRSQSRPAEHGDQYGYNDAVHQEFRQTTGVELREDLDPELRQSWRDLLGAGLTQLLRQLAAVLRERGVKLAVGAPRGDVLGPPLGNATLAWRDWVREGLVDELVVNQNSSRCPSMWHDLWPMHRGNGYLQSYLDGSGMPPLEDQLRERYGPVFRNAPARLLVARQWDERNRSIEDRLAGIAGVDGLVFSSFRHDNPGPIARGDWRA